MVSLELFDLRKPELWGSVVKTSVSMLSSRDTFWRSRKRSRFNRLRGWVTSTSWIGLVGEPRGVWEGVGFGVITLFRDCTLAPWSAVGAPPTGSSLSSLKCCGVTGSGLQGESGRTLLWVPGAALGRALP